MQNQRHKDPKEEVIEILMRRDKLEYGEAKDILEETLEIVYEMIEKGWYWQAEETFMSDIGLEVDYLMNLL